MQYNIQHLNNIHIKARPEDGYGVQRFLMLTETLRKFDRKRDDWQTRVRGTKNYIKVYAPWNTEQSLVLVKGKGKNKNKQKVQELRLYFFVEIADQRNKQYLKLINIDTFPCLWVAVG